MIEHAIGGVGVLSIVIGNTLNVNLKPIVVSLGSGFTSGHVS